MDIVGRVARQQWRRAAANARAVSRLRPRDEAAEHRDLLLLPPLPRTPRTLVPFAALL